MRYDDYDLGDYIDAVPLTIHYSYDTDLTGIWADYTGATYYL